MLEFLYLLLGAGRVPRKCTIVVSAQYFQRFCVISLKHRVEMSLPSTGRFLHIYISRFLCVLLAAMAHGTTTSQPDEFHRGEEGIYTKWFRSSSPEVRNTGVCVRLCVQTLPYAVRTFHISFNRTIPFMCAAACSIKLTNHHLNAGRVTPTTPVELVA